MWGPVRRWLPPIVVMLLVVGALAPAQAQTDELDDVRQAVQDGEDRVTESRARSDEAARAFQEARAANHVLEARIEGLRMDVTVAETELGELRVRLQDLAIDRYVESGTTPTILEAADVMSHERAEALRDVVFKRDVDTLDEYRLVKARLEDTEGELEGARPAPRRERSPGRPLLPSQANVASVTSTDVDRPGVPGGLGVVP